MELGWGYQSKSYKVSGTFFFYKVERTGKRHKQQLTDSAQVERFFTNCQDFFHEPRGAIKVLGFAHQLEQIHDETVFVTELLRESRRKVAQLSQKTLHNESHRRCELPCQHTSDTYDIAKRAAAFDL